MSEKLTPKEWFLKLEGESMLDAVAKRDKALRGDSRILSEDGRLFHDRRDTVSLPEGAGASGEAPLSLAEARAVAGERIEFLSREAGHFLEKNGDALVLSRYLFAANCLVGRLLYELCSLAGADPRVVEHIERSCIAADTALDGALLDYLRDVVLPDVRKRVAKPVDMPDDPRIDAL